MNLLRKILIGGAMTGTALLGGAVGASILGTAGAQTEPTTTAAPQAAPDAPTTSAPAPAEPDQDHDAHKGGHHANGITETLLTGDDAAKATAAAEAAVPGATVERAETDAEGAAYEVHMTKSDGSEVTVKLDSSFTVTETINGRG
jgi:hypothetical protein